MESYGVHYHILNSPQTDPNLSHINQARIFPLYLRSILILSSHLRLGLPSGFFPSCHKQQTTQKTQSDERSLRCQFL
jgi:hypothetical protein